MKVLSLGVLIAFSSLAQAGDAFRMHSKAPAIALPKPKPSWYAFGFFGYDFAGEAASVGSFNLVNNFRDICQCPIDPLDVPLNLGVDDAWVFGGGAGIYSGLAGGSRFELEGSYFSRDVGSFQFANQSLPTDLEFKTTTVMFNMLKEVPLGNLTGYLGGGVGWGWTKAEGSLSVYEFNDHTDGFAWQLIAGVDIPVTERLALFIQYRYLVLDEFEFTDQVNDFSFATQNSQSSHGILLGARVSF